MDRMANKATVATLILLAMTAAGSSFGQTISGPGCGARMRAPCYDPATEMTVNGTVEEVQQIPGRPGGAGTHLKLKTETGTFDVHLGPSFFMKQRGFSFSKGDNLEITGSKDVSGQGEALVTRVIRKGDKTLTLRDEKGFPLWSRRSGGSQ